MSGPKQQLTVADLKSMTPEAILEAKAGGLLNRVLGIPDEETALVHRARNASIDITDVRELNRLGRHDLVADAQRAGRITHGGDAA